MKEVDQRTQEEHQQYFNQKLIRNNRIAAGAIFFSQTVLIFLHGFFVAPSTSVGNSSLFIPTGIALLTLIGFTLLFSQIKNNLWSTLGFNLLITAFTFQMYFLVSGFWNMVNISGSSPYNFQTNIKDQLSDTIPNVITYGITAAGAFKCALSNIIVFGSLAGKAGVMEALMVSVVGTFLYELNRQLISRISSDLGGSMSIFCYAGFFGGTISFILYRCKQRVSVFLHPYHKATHFSWMLSLVGSAFCWVFFPFLSIDSQSSLFINYTGGINSLFAVSTSVLVSVGISSIIHGKLDLKDLIYSPVIGGVIIGSSSTLIYNTLGAILLGATAAIIQIFLNRFQRKIRGFLFVSNNSFFLFGIQGLLGGMLSAIFVQLNALYNSKIYSTLTTYPYVTHDWSSQLAGTGISVGIGIFSGLVLSVPLIYLTEHTVNDHFHDRAYWVVNSDGISLYDNVQYSSIDQDDQLEKQSFEEENDSEVQKIQVEL